MKFVVPVSLREYPESESNDPLFIAETLNPPYVSVASPAADAALADIRDVVKQALERAHPRMIGQNSGAAIPAITRDSAPLYGTAAYDWNASANGWDMEDQLCFAPVDVQRRELEGGLIELSLPLFGAWTIIDPAQPAKRSTKDDDPEAPTEPEPIAVRDLADALRVAGRMVSLHRPTPKEMTVVALEVEFEPLDLAGVPIQAIWMSEFGDDDLELPDASGPPPTPTLDEVAQCWSSATPAEGSDRGFVESFGRGATIAELEELLDGQLPSAVVLVGPARVGKTAIVKHLAWQRIHDPASSTRRLWFADAPRLTSTDAYSMDWREQCRAAVAELEEVDDVLYLGRLIEVLDAGKYVGSDYNLAQFLKPVLSDRRIRVIAEATIEEWNEVERRDVGFARAFTVVRIEDPREEEARLVVKQAVERLAAREGVTVPLDAINRSWALQRRFSLDGSTVGRTIDFVRRSVRVAANAFRKTIMQVELVEEFCKYTGLPSILLMDDRQLDIDRVAMTIGSRVLGQDEAVRRVADVIGITKAGLSSPDKPLGSFLFVGPTGVGKTELARALAAYLFGDDERLVRIDMSEYSHSDAYSRLIGEGREDGDLTGPIRRQPFSVILLDEVEKAHPGVFDLLLQVLGEARLTDVNGRMTGFRNTIVIMTSNLGVDSLRPAIGFGDESVADAWASHFRREAERFFRPEFLARIDQFIPFRPLTEDVVRRIAHREVAQVFDRDGLRSQDVELEIDDRVYEWLASRGWDQRYGARPLKRVIEQELVAELSRRLADSRPALEAGTARTVRVGVGAGPVRKANLEWKLEFVSGRRTDASARRALLTQLEEIADLRRRLQRYMGTVVFGDLEWRVENFDVSSQSKQFWEDGHASDLATEAEHARRVVEPAYTIATELAAMEDLANEAYHGRSFALSGDIDERVVELTERVRAVVLEILRGAYEDPDRIALFLYCRSADDAWRRQLIGWYAARAKNKDWKLSTWRPKSDRDLAGIAWDESQAYDEARITWEETQEFAGDVIVLLFEGFAARPLSRPEDGLHRLISADGNASVDVWELEEYAGWPWAQAIGPMSSRTYIARSYNYRTREVTMPNAEPAKLDPVYPFSTLEVALEELAWRITDSEWE